MNNDLLFAVLFSFLGALTWRNLLTHFPKTYREVREGRHAGSIQGPPDTQHDVFHGILQRYLPWGSERGGENTPPSDRRYTGQISDATAAASGDTGLLYYNARYYDPTLGAFAAADTIVPNLSVPPDLNRYAHVRDNPVNAIDPSGHCGLIAGPDGEPVEDNHRGPPRAGQR